VGNARVVPCQKKDEALNGSYSAVKQGALQLLSCVILRARGHFANISEKMASLLATKILLIKCVYEWSYFK
jgi:hypothetical protein